jgi:hypothetical protein
MNASQLNSGPSGSVGFSGLLGIAFIVLKLCHVIDWRWLWVLAPIWIPICIGLICIVGALINYMVNRRR